MRPVVLVHGAWHGPWCWDRVTPLLDAGGVRWAAADLPSCADADAGAGLVEDVQTVERILDELPGDEPAILVGHSRAGLVISEAGAHERVGQLVYLTAFLVEPDSSYREMVADTVLPILEVGPDAVALPKAELGAPVFYNDCAPGDVRWAQARLRPMHMAGAAVEPPRRAWASRPSTYVVCALDGAIPAHHQRHMAEQATHVVEWNTGHSPFINRPDLVADLLLGLAAAET
jgi:pimeloyl-ACP methyl ester carboxylesterase